MNEVERIIANAQQRFREQLLAVEATGGLTIERYTRFLSMQFHLTNGVQKHFLRCAANSSMLGRKSLRKFLVSFAEEEEQHYLIAKRDLDNLGVELLPCPLDVALWWTYFDHLVDARPFVRLGATTILENISKGNNEIIRRLLGAATYLNPRNTRFVVIHQHEDLPHGDQILQVLAGADLSALDCRDLEEGADTGMIFYLRFFSWVASGHEAAK